MTEQNTYEKDIIEIMLREKCTFSTAMYIDFIRAGIDYNSVFDLVDYLEVRTNDLDTVAYYMEVYTGKKNDMILESKNAPKKET